VLALSGLLHSFNILCWFSFRLPVRWLQSLPGILHILEQIL
jgi:hypothetical protein